MSSTDLDLGAALTRFQRVLLGTDGTVTRILEAYAAEPIEVVKLLQVIEIPAHGDALLGLSGDERVLRRRVLLRGARSGRNLLYAEAGVVVERVDRRFLDGLLATDRSVGVLLAETRAETFREIAVVGREPAGPNGVHFDLHPTADLLFRTYRIVAGGRPIISITEKFPADSFRELAP